MKASGKRQQARGNRQEATVIATVIVTKAIVTNIIMNIIMSMSTTNMSTR